MDRRKLRERQPARLVQRIGHTNADIDNGTSQHPFDL
jgi:hypothetical protein